MNSLETYRVVGVMSGTSLDGLDIAICTFRKEDVWSYKIHKAVTIKYNQEIINLLQEAYTCSSDRLMEIDFQFGSYIGNSVLNFIDKVDEKIDFISSHGHTILHQPDKNFTLQIGSGAAIVAKTGIKTICNFRQLDVARGGQGAPLVPIGDKLLFGKYSACLNLGGFANVSFEDNGQRIAFDICPVNILLNYLCRQIGLDYDKDGEIALSGKRIPELFDKLNSLNYYAKKAPKSLGQEWVEEHVYPIFDLFKHDDRENLIKTCTDHIAYQISKVLNMIIGDGPVLITGGGAHNKYLIHILSEIVHNSLILPDDQLIDFKEALIFAFLGVLRIRGEYNCLASVTGASKNSISGNVYVP